MPGGTLEVLLVGAKGLEDTDFFSNMDPYVILTCRTQEQKSSVASGKGSEPEWNESFVFTVSDEASELSIKIMDSDAGSEDDFVGEATIPLEAVFMEGSVPTAPYNVVKDEEYRGEIKIALTFTPEVILQHLILRLFVFEENGYDSFLDYIELMEIENATEPKKYTKK